VIVAGQPPDKKTLLEETMLRFGSALSILTAVFSCNPCVAQDYPSRPIRVLMATPAGGTGDVFMRALGDRISKELGQPLIIENRPGGAFNIATRACAEAAPDGYTLCLLPGEPLTFNQFLFKSLPYDPAAFEPITQTFNTVLSLVVNKSLEVKTLPELIAASKAKPGALSYSVLSVPFGLFFDRIIKTSGADIVRVPFRGGNEQVNGLLSGSTPVAFTGLSNIRGQLEAGSVIGLMVDSSNRSPLFPEIPTITEATGLQYPTRSYFGMVAPPGTPKPIVNKIYNVIAEIINERSFQDTHLHARGLEPALSKSPEDFARFMQKDRDLAGSIIREAGIEPQ
jgi:tripartite-type tricarboxylate transporter receptor subunit TctC